MPKIVPSFKRNKYLTYIHYFIKERNTKFGANEIIYGTVESINSLKYEIPLDTVLCLQVQLTMMHENRTIYCRYNI